MKSALYLCLLSKLSTISSSHSFWEIIDKMPGTAVGTVFGLRSECGCLRVSSSGKEVKTPQVTRARHRHTQNYPLD
jgi:hypothetical protein